MKILPKLLLLLLITGLLTCSCKEKPTPPFLVTDNISEITPISALTGGTVTDDGGTEVTERGVCWGFGKDPKTDESKKSNGKGTGAFTVNLSGLTPNTLYHVRAYAINAEGTGYGNDNTFTTSQITKAAISTVELTSITTNSASSGGIISSDNGGPITEKGVCWNITPNPTPGDFKSDAGAGSDNFTCVLSGLQSWTTYYIRAYAKNSAGTAYGEELSFKTAAIPPVMNTRPVINITGTSAASGGNILSDGGLTITARGICWSKSQNPTIADTHSSDASGTGVFTSDLTGLTANSTYYLRAYATNESGTYYGKQFYFVSTAPGQVTDQDGNTYNTIAIGMYIIMKENLRTKKYSDLTDIPLVTNAATWCSLTTPGYCWYNNDETTYKSTYGALYNWYAVNTNKLCPSGWRVPSKDDWNAILVYLNDNGYNYDGSTLMYYNRVAKALASTDLWNSSAVTGAAGNSDYPEMRNASGFSALPSGMRDDFGDFGYLGEYTAWWSSFQESNVAWFIRVLYNQSYSNLNGSLKILGQSVRCIKN